MGLLPGGQSCHGGAPVAAEGVEGAGKQVKLYT